MKIKYLILVIIILIIILSVAVMSGMLNSKKDKYKDVKVLKDSPFTTSFFEAGMAVNFTEDDWKEELREWKEMNLQYIVIGETAYCDNGKWYTYYPSKISGTTMNYDSVDIILKHCKKANMKFFICGGNNPSPANLCKHDKDNNGKGQESFIESIKSTLPFAEELYNKYYKEYKDLWYGWYFSPEISNNIDWENSEYFKIGVQTLSDSLNICLDKYRSFNKNFTIMLSPYLNLDEKATWVTKDANVIKKYWTEVINNTNFKENDVLAPQDCVDNYNWDYQKLEKFTKVYRDAISESNKNIKLWMNLLIAIGSDGSETSKYTDLAQTTYINRMIKQIDTEKQYVDGFMSFSFCYYLSKPNNIAGYYNTYKDYLQYGIIDVQDPKAPNSLSVGTITINQKNTLNIKFSGMDDDYGIARAVIYKNGKEFTYRTATRLASTYNGERVGNQYPNQFFDTEFNLDNDQATYKIVVYDCSENKSKDSLDFKVKSKNGKISYEIIKSSN